MRQKTLNWCDPLTMAENVLPTETHWILLYSGLQQKHTGNTSYLALCQNQEIISTCFQSLEHALTNNDEPLNNAWFGYLGYDLKNTLEDLPEDIPGKITMPAMWLHRFHLILQFHHPSKTLTAYATDETWFKKIPGNQQQEAINSWKIEQLTSNMSKQDYIKKVKTIKEAIYNGDLYQANLTRKFYGTISNAKPITLFRKLCEISPSPYSAFLKTKENHILSSSPERFLTIDAAGHVETRPIKGSAPRFNDPKKDQQSKDGLRDSKKDQAENLMIVDLSRNDLSRTCLPGSVTVEDLHAITSYATVHHMASTVKGKKEAGKTALDVVKNSFPPGSMTGTPKIKAMELCSSLERQQRGIYAGALGWFGGDGSADLSVVIRTLIMQGNRFEFQVGGAIVADSDPIQEWQETLTKAKAIATVLGLTTAQLEQ